MASSSPPARLTFDPVDTSSNPQHSHDDVESPSLSSSNALARFEFEPGRSSKDGTKVLMVEWDEDEVTKEIDGDWEISWDGKRTTLPARDHDHSNGDSNNHSEQPVNRLYFLLGPGIAVPTAVRLQKGDVTWRTNPLPAIFAPELGATARQAGKKGVLHTVWAKKRLQVLQTEIEHESKNNAEGIGLEMAIAEKEWIEQNFGVVARPTSNILNSSAEPVVTTTDSSLSSLHAQQQQLNSPTSPRSPGGGRLMDKLKGLKLGTSDRALRTAGGASTPGDHNPLSPESSDVAVSGFSSFSALKGTASSASSSTSSLPPLSSLTATASQPNHPQQPQQQRMVAQRPPDAPRWQPQHGMGSLNAFAVSSNNNQTSRNPNTNDNVNNNKVNNNDDDDDEDDTDDLFALPMSPRSPEMTKSPFSFAHQDLSARFVEGRTA